MWLSYSRRYLPILVAVAAILAAVVHHHRPAHPTVKLDQAVLTGLSDGEVNHFLGIPYAKPPVGHLRFNAPVMVDPYEGSHSAAEYGPWCPQQSLNSLRLPPMPKAAIDFFFYLWDFGGNPTAPPVESEDCLSLNVITPATAKPGANLPVVVWIYGGGFETGAAPLYPGAPIVKRSIAVDEPMIYVSINYRLTGFGFLAGKEVKEAGLGNLGLRDQRLAFRWIQKYISAFGGDPSKVAIWGESAGGISVAMHMVANNGDTEGLFRAAFMQSGGPITMGDIVSGQGNYDVLVKKVGCSGTKDTLECLRQADYAVLKKAMDEFHDFDDAQSLRLNWVPRVDGKFLTARPMDLVQQGKIANIPFVTGNCDDEATTFAFVAFNITTDEEFRDYISRRYFPDVPQAEVNRLLQLYPSDPAQGSPFDTGTLNVFTPQFKRLAALTGDWLSHAPRRFMLKHRSGKQKAWAYLTKRHKDVPLLGATHGTDLKDLWEGGPLLDYLIHFVSRLDPNGNTGNTSVAWPRYSTDSPRLLTLLDDAHEPVALTEDTFRFDGLELMQDLTLRFPSDRVPAPYIHV